ncbi:MAG: response regulator [Clostridiales bacterium]|nr:response regulator [Clostridiales bacterium]
MPYKVVIIDDEPWTREAIRGLGDWAGLSLDIVGEASDGESGLALIRQIKPDIVLTDIMMPLLNGLELIEAVRKEDTSVRVILISGYDDFEYARRALRMDVSDYLLKPVKREELNEKLKNCIGQLDRFSDMDKRELDRFGDAEWMREYAPLYASLQSILLSNNGAAVSAVFDGLSASLSHSGTRDGLIVLYYDLTGLLERHVVNMGYHAGDLIDRRGFVFGNETTSGEIVSFLRRRYLETLETLKKLSQNRSSVDIEMIVKYVDAYAHQGITLEQTAQQFFVSREYLGKAFKEHTGKHFTDYTTSLRMEKAKDLLLGGVPIKQIHLVLGFSEQAHFYKVFKRYFGTTPGGMRRQFTDRQ